MAEQSLAADNNDREKETNRLMGIWEKARIAMEKAEGTKDYPRMCIEHDIARLAYQLAYAEGKLDRQSDVIRELTLVVQGQNRNIATLTNFLDEIPGRLLRLENAYASLHMASHQKQYVENLIQAYQKGLQRTDDREKTNGVNTTPKGE